MTQWDPRPGREEREDRGYQTPTQTLPIFTPSRQSPRDSSLWQPVPLVNTPDIQETYSLRWRDFRTTKETFKAKTTSPPETSKILRSLKDPKVSTKDPKENNQNIYMETEGKNQYKNTRETETPDSSTCSLRPSRWNQWPRPKNPKRTGVTTYYGTPVHPTTRTCVGTGIEQD